MPNWSRAVHRLLSSREAPPSIGGDRDGGSVGERRIAASRSAAAAVGGERPGRSASAMWPQSATSALQAPDLAHRACVGGLDEP